MCQELCLQCIQDVPRVPVPVYAHFLHIHVPLILTINWYPVFYMYVVHVRPAIMIITIVIAMMIKLEYCMVHVYE